MYGTIITCLTYHRVTLHHQALNQQQVRIASTCLDSCVCNPHSLFVISSIDEIAAQQARFEAEQEASAQRAKEKRNAFPYGPRENLVSDTQIASIAYHASPITIHFIPTIFVC